MIRKVFAVGVVFAIVIVGVVAYAVLKPPQEASGPIEAIPVVLEEKETVAPTHTPEPEPTSKAAPTATDAPEATESGNTSAADTDAVIFQIVQAESEARFFIDEVLNGSPKTVVGVTDQVAGEIAIFLDDPVGTKIGSIQVNARTLTTDNNFRNRAIKNRILQTDNFEFITFTPTEIIGLADSATVGESFTLQVVGDLTVRDVTNKVTFEATVTPTSETRLEGSAVTSILYPDYNLVIPSVPQVAGVDEEVILEIDFVAVAK